MSKLVIFDTDRKIEKLNHLPFNRNHGVRKDLIEKMNAYGFTVPMNIIETDVFDGVKKLWIADGQHRLDTAIFLGIAPTGIVNTIEFKDVESIVMYVSSLNTTQKAWNLLNYIEAYNFLGLKDYAFLIKKVNTTPYTANSIAMIYGGYRKSNYIADKVREGEFVIENRKNGDYSLALSAELSKFERVTNRMLIALNYVAGQKGFNENKFVRLYKANVTKIKELKLDNYTDIFTEWGLR